MAGGLISCAGFVLSSFATSIFALFICIGIITGVGCSLCYLPSMAVVSLYFHKRRAMAIGLATTGTGVGSFLCGPLIDQLIQAYTWRGAMLILGGLCLQQCVAGALVRPLAKHRDDTRATLGPDWRDQEYDIASDDDAQAKAADESNGILQPCQIDAESLAATLIDERLSGADVDVVNESHPDSTLEIFLEEVDITDDDKKLLPVTSGIYASTENKLPDIKSSLCSITRSVHVKLSNNHLASIRTDDRTKGGSMQLLPHPSEAQDSRQFSSVVELRHQPGKHERILVTSLKNLDLMFGGSAFSIVAIETKTTEPHLSSWSVAPPDASVLANHGLSYMERLKASCSINVALLTNVGFLLLALSNFLTNLSYIVNPVYMVDRAVSNGIDKSSAAVLVSVYGVGNIVGRLFFGWLLDRACVNELAMYAITLVAAGTVTSLSALCGGLMSLHALYIFSFGFLIGCYANAWPLVAVNLVGLSMVNQSFGVTLWFMGAGTLTGTPFAGWIYDITGVYTSTFIIHGLFVVFSGLFLVPIPALERRRKHKLHN